MAYTDVGTVVRFARLNYNDSVDESLTAADSSYKYYYVTNKPVFDDTTTTVYKNNSSCDTSTYSLEKDIGRILFTTANNATDSIKTTYTYCDVSSQTINDFIKYSDTVIANTIQDTTRDDAMEVLSNFLTSHLIYKNIASKSGRGGMSNYSIGFFSVGKGTSPAMEIANMFYKNYQDWSKSLETYKGMKMTWMQSGNDAWDKYYSATRMKRDDQETIMLTNSPGMTYDTET